jgi:hypothetical protein
MEKSVEFVCIVYTWYINFKFSVVLAVKMLYIREYV